MVSLWSLRGCFGSVSGPTSRSRAALKRNGELKVERQTERERVLERDIYIYIYNLREEGMTGIRRGKALQAFGFDHTVSKRAHPFRPANSNLTGPG